MADTNEAEVFPVEKVPNSEYEDASYSFDRGGADLDGLCIQSAMAEAVAQALCELAGGDWYDELLLDDEDQTYWLEQGGRAVDALIRLGVLRREDFAYVDGRPIRMNDQVPVLGAQLTQKAYDVLAEDIYSRIDDEVQASYRTVCASGKEHATFAVAGAAITKRCKQVRDYDDGQGCGPHAVEVSRDGGATWGVIEFDVPFGPMREDSL